MDQKKNLTDLEFEVLFKANFPEDIEQAIFTQKYHIDKAIKEGQPTKFSSYLVGIDVARGGKDYTVATIIGKHKDTYHFIEYFKFDENNLMKVTGLIQHYLSKYPKDKVSINVDVIGLGAGVKDRLAELEYDVGEFNSQTKPTDKRFYNYKAEQIFALADIMKDGRFYNLPTTSPYILELKKWIFEPRAGKIRVIDPEDKSPDFADSLVIAMAEGNKLVFDFM